MGVDFHSSSRRTLSDRDDDSEENVGECSPHERTDATRKQEIQPVSEWVQVFEERKERHGQIGPEHAQPAP